MMATIFAVQRRSWAIKEWDGRWRCGSYREDEDDGGVPVAIFMDQATATQRRDELSAAARHETNPFWYGDGALHSLTNLTKEALADRVSELGLTPPPKARERPLRLIHEYADWYDDLASQLTDAQRDGVWDLLYAVVPVELEE